jgi:hypothetical protein
MVQANEDVFRRPGLRVTGLRVTTQRLAGRRSTSASSSGAARLWPRDGTGYEVDDTEDPFWGLCPDCQLEDSQAHKELVA